MNALKEFLVTARVNGKLTSGRTFGYNVADAQSRFKDEHSGSVSFVSCKQIS